MSQLYTSPTILLERCNKTVRHSKEESIQVENSTVLYCTVLYCTVLYNTEEGKQAQSTVQYTFDVGISVTGTSLWRVHPRLWSGRSWW